jgi:hypothetical protein
MRSVLVVVTQQIFNEINARKVHNELYVFDSLHKNRQFVFIWFFTVLVQVLIVEFGSLAFKVKPLDWGHWLICIVCSSLSIYSLPLGVWCTAARDAAVVCAVCATVDYP